jgi:hypothetical protein
MKLRFEVNRAEALRRGVDVSQPIVTIEVNPQELTQEDRNLVADRLDGIDVYELNSSRRIRLAYSGSLGEVPKPKRMVAGLPTFEALMEAIRKNESDILPRTESQTEIIHKIMDIAREHPRTPL